MKDQQHPQEYGDRQIIDNIIDAEPTPENLTEIARLLIRYQNFPGARSIQTDIETIMTRWGLNRETLYEKTRQIYASGKLGHQKLGIAEIQDWS